MITATDTCVVIGDRAVLIGDGPAMRPAQIPSAPPSTSRIDSLVIAVDCTPVGSDQRQARPLAAPEVISQIAARVISLCGCYPLDRAMAVGWYSGASIPTAGFHRDVEALEATIRGMAGRHRTRAPRLTSSLFPPACSPDAVVAAITDWCG